MKRLSLFFGLFTVAAAATFAEILVVQGEKMHTLAGRVLEPGVAVIQEGKIVEVGKAGEVKIPEGARLIKAKVITPGLIDAHCVIGFSGMLNQPHDQEQLEKSAPMQPELRATDGYNPMDPLVEFVRKLGVTTIHTGHGPGTLISGQTMIVKTHPAQFEKAGVNPAAMIAATLGSPALNPTKDKAPGTVAKAVAMLRAELIKAQEYQQKLAKPDADKRPARDLRMETLGKLLEGKMPLLVTVNRHQDILAALRLADEFKFKLVLDGVADAPLILDQIKKSGFPVLAHPTMARATGDSDNLSFETASALKNAGIPFALQSGFEAYVPKTRVVLFEAAIAAANGLGFEAALASITIDAAKILGIHERTGSIEKGKDADLALFDGDPFEYTTHCTGTVVSGILTDRGEH